MKDEVLGHANNISKYQIFWKSFFKTQSNITDFLRKTEFYENIESLAQLFLNHANMLNLNLIHILSLHLK